MKSLFLTAWLQVSLVALNTWQIANGKLIGALVVGFGISFVWSFNIKRIAFANNAERIVYCLGASAGTATGLILSKIIY